MAAIIAQLTLANRRRKKNAKGYLPCDKSNYILKPFDPVFEPKKHVLYLLKRDHYEYKHEIKTKAKEFADDMKSNDLEFYYFMRYGKVPLRFINPEAVVESDNCEYKQRKSINILKAFVAGFALLFFTVLFLIMFISALKVDPDFVNQVNTTASQS